jgi:hypothetical protein
MLIMVFIVFFLNYGWKWGWIKNSLMGLVKYSF